MLIASVLVACLLSGTAWAASATSPRLVVAGAPPTHEATLPHLGSISQKLPTRVVYEYLTDVDPASWTTSARCWPSAG